MSKARSDVYYTVYCLVERSTKKVVYVGCTCDPHSRSSAHCKLPQDCSPALRKKYLPKEEFHVLVNKLNLCEGRLLEEELIKKYKTTLRNKTPGQVPPECR